LWDLEYDVASPQFKLVGAERVGKFQDFLCMRVSQSKTPPLHIRIDERIDATNLEQVEKTNRHAFPDWRELPTPDRRGVVTPAPRLKIIPA
jgi:hypothetical protein